MAYIEPIPCSALGECPCGVAESNVRVFPSKRFLEGSSGCYVGRVSRQISGFFGQVCFVSTTCVQTHHPSGHHLRSEVPNVRRPATVWGLIDPCNFDLVAKPVTPFFRLVHHFRRSSELVEDSRQNGKVPGQGPPPCSFGRLHVDFAAVCGWAPCSAPHKFTRHVGPFWFTKFGALEDGKGKHEQACAVCDLVPPSIPPNPDLSKPPPTQRAEAIARVLSANEAEIETEVYPRFPF